MIRWRLVRLCRQAAWQKNMPDAFAEAQKNAISEMVESKEFAGKADMLRLENKLLEKIENNKHEIKMDENLITRADCAYCGSGCFFEIVENIIRLK